MRRNAIIATVTFAAALTAFGASTAGAAPAPSAAPAAFTCSQLGTPPSDARLYVDRMLAAWGYGQRAQVGCYAVDPAVQFAFAERGKNVGSWVFVSKTRIHDEHVDVVTYRGGDGATMVARGATTFGAN
ncbi:MAG: hypothetical protein LCH77_04070 [Actinobacteria bacterium]|nr:hypothetical protein [Actinomycetota bacterium]